MTFSRYLSLAKKARSVYWKKRPTFLEQGAQAAAVAVPISSTAVIASPTPTSTPASNSAPSLPPTSSFYVSNGMLSPPVVSIAVPSASRRKIDLFRTSDDSSHSDNQSSFPDYLDDYHLVKMRNNQDVLLRLSIYFKQ